MTLDCHRHRGYVIWLGGSPRTGWCYAVTPTAVSIGLPVASLGEEDAGKPFRTKTRALTRARARIRQIIKASPPRGGGHASTLTTS
jgi:hypothetical protein